MVSKPILIILSIIVSFPILGQEHDSCEMGYPFHTAPEYEGDLRSFIQSSIKYPESAIFDSIEGRVIIAYKVDTVGNTYDHVVERGLSKDLNKEALRVTRMIKYKKPAYYYQKPVIFYFSIPVIFEIDTTLTLDSSRLHRSLK